MKTLKKLFILGIATLGSVSILSSCGGTTPEPTPTPDPGPTPTPDPGKNKDFENLVMKASTVKYDGNVHSLVVENVPSFASVTYTNNDKVNVGTYNVTATVKATGYNTATLTAKLVIQALDFEGLVFNDQTFTYDGNAHSIYVENVPNFASVTYTNNNKIEVGTYTVTAKVSATNYSTKTLTAKMVIAKIAPTFDVGDRTLIYDGTEQKVVINFPDDIEKYYDYAIKVDGKAVTLDTAKVKTVGNHTVSVTLSRDGYTSSTSTATIKVIENNIGGVDSKKTAFNITNKTKYAELREAVLNGNFTIKEEYWDDFVYPDKTEKHTQYYTSMMYVNNNEAFEYYDKTDKSTCGVYEFETTFTHQKIVNNEFLKAHFEAGLTCDANLEKFPSSAFHENVVGDYGFKPLGFIKADTDGYITANNQGDYATKYGSFVIDEVNNKITITVCSYYYKTEWDHIERAVYTLYNIGNTTLNVPNELKADNLDYSRFSAYSYSLNGISYYFNTTAKTPYARGNLYFDAPIVSYLGTGEFIVPAYMGDLPVKEYQSSYYAYLYNQDCSNLTYKVYFDKNGYYQGEYEDLGFVSGYKEFGDFIDDGGTILYYDDWH